MRLALIRAGVILLFATLLQACGGNGGSKPARLSVSTTAVSVTAEPGDAAPHGTVVLTVDHPPKDGWFVSTNLTGPEIETTEVESTSTTESTMSIAFQLPSELQDGTYDGSVEVHVCTDAPCTDEIEGSPVTIATSYEISGGATGTLDRNSVAVATDTVSNTGKQEVIQLTLDRAPAIGFQVYVDYNIANAIAQATVTSQTPSTANVTITFKPGATLGSGTFNDSIRVTVCYDFGCVRQVGGSPFTISTHIVVGGGAEPGYTPLAVASRITLPHNVIDAEFSKALNAVVMVGSYPVNALYVYDVASGAEQQQLLAKAPTAVSVSPDGQSAAVGHDALISVVALPTVGQPGAPAPILLDVSTDVLDLVLDARGHVHALPRVNQWQQIHTVDIASNTEKFSTGRQIYAGAHGRLHPDGDYIYTADTLNISPGDLNKWAVTTDQARWSRDSPYHGDYDMGEYLWFKEDGTRIYTTVGNTFTSSPGQAGDMLYAGAIELTTEDWFWIRSLSESDASHEIALIEYEVDHCDLLPTTGPCYTHFALYESDFLNRLAVYSISPVTVDDTAYAQFGLFVFHAATDNKKIMISRLEGMTDPATEYYLSVID